MICCALAVMVLASWLGLASLFGRAPSTRGNPLAWRPAATKPQGSATPARPFSVHARIRSFAHAGAGVRFLWTTEHNARIHLAATILAIVAGIALDITAADWRWIAAAIAWVWFAEGVNTAIEHLCDVVHPGLHDGIRVAKDVAAGAVLISAIGAAIVGIVTLAPYGAALFGTGGIGGAVCQATP